MMMWEVLRRCSADNSMSHPRVKSMEGGSKQPIFLLPTFKSSQFASHHAFVASRLCVYSMGTQVYNLVDKFKFELNEKLNKVNSAKL